MCLSVYIGYSIKNLWLGVNILNSLKCRWGEPTVRQMRVPYIQNSAVMVSLESWIAYNRLPPWAAVHVGCSIKNPKITLDVRMNQFRCSTNQGTDSDIITPGRYGYVFNIPSIKWSPNLHYPCSKGETLWNRMS